MISEREKQLEVENLSLKRKIYEALDHPDMPDTVRAAMLAGHAGDVPTIVRELTALRELADDLQARNHGLTSQLQEAKEEARALSLALKAATEA